MSKKDLIILLDGKYIQADAVLRQALTPGVLKARGVFETMRFYQSHLFAFSHHMDRMQRGLKLLNINLPFKRNWILSLILTLYQRNDLKKARCRVAVWKEKNQVRHAIVCEPCHLFPESQYHQGFKALISDIRRNRTKWTSIKSLDYASCRQAFLQAKEKGCDEAILLNSRNEIVEGSRSNIFFIKKDVLYTPSVHSGCLNGVTRHIVLQLARAMGYKVHVGVFDRRVLTSADEIFLTNSVREVMPITVLEGKKIGQGECGAHTHALKKAYTVFLESVIFTDDR